MGVNMYLAFSGYLHEESAKTLDYGCKWDRYDRDYSSSHGKYLHILNMLRKLIYLLTYVLKEKGS